MRNYLWVLFGLGIATPTLAMEYKPFIELSSFIHNEPFAIMSEENGWNVPLKPGKVALLMNRVELGIGIDNWQFSVFERSDYLFEFDDATAKLIYYTKSKQKLVPGEEYSLYFDSNAFIARGLKLGYQQKVSGFNVGVALSYLEGLNLTDGTLQGQATATANNDYNFDFDVDYYYSEDSLFDRKIDSNPQGNGYGIDLSVEGFLLPQWHASLKVEDLFAQIHWWDAPRTVATGSSQTKEYDDEGYVVFKPVASGTESNEDFTQQIPPKVFISSQYEFIEQHSVLVDYQDYSIKQFYSVGYRFVTDNQHKMDILYNVTAEAWQIGYANKWLKFDLITDQLEFDTARTLGLSMALNYKF